VGGTCGPSCTRRSTHYLLTTPIWKRCIDFRSVKHEYTVPRNRRAATLVRLTKSTYCTCKIFLADKLKPGRWPIWRGRKRNPMSDSHRRYVMMWVNCDRLRSWRPFFHRRRRRRLRALIAYGAPPCEKWKTEFHYRGGRAGGRAPPLWTSRVELNHAGDSTSAQRRQRLQSVSDRLLTRCRPARPSACPLALQSTPQFACWSKYTMTAIWRLSDCIAFMLAVQRLPFVGWLHGLTGSIPF